MAQDAFTLHLSYFLMLSSHQGGVQQTAGGHRDACQTERSPASHQRQSLEKSYFDNKLHVYASAVGASTVNTSVFLKVLARSNKAK